MRRVDQDVIPLGRHNGATLCARAFANLAEAAYDSPGFAQAVGYDEHAAGVAALGAAGFDAGLDPSLAAWLGENVFAYDYETFWARLLSTGQNIGAPHIGRGEHSHCVIGAPRPRSRVRYRVYTLRDNPIGLDGGPPF